MRRRTIKSVAHWVIMSVVLLFPILMVGISSFAQSQQEINVTETWEYETNEVNSVDDLIVGNIYHASLSINDFENLTDYSGMRAYAIYNLDALNYECNYKKTTDDTFLLLYKYRNEVMISKNVNDIETYIGRIQNISDNFTIIDFDFVFVGSNGGMFSALTITQSDYLGEKTIDYTITDQTMREDVNQWCASFRNLPVNQWYGNLLNAVGLGITTSMMMNVIYTYPLYVLWVYILDLVVDIFLVIINFGHNALKRLGGDNE